MENGEIIKGHRHNDCIRTARDIPRFKEMQVFEQGFIDSFDEFVDRETAMFIEKVVRMKKKSKKPFLHEKLLFSEDLY